MTAKIVGRGYVVVYKRDGVYGPPRAVTAVVSGPRAKELQRSVGGKIVNVAGQPYRMAQRTLRVLTNPNAAIKAAHDGLDRVAPAPLPVYDAFMREMFQ